MRPAEILDTLRALQPELRAEGVTHIALFGSRARGDENRASDIDLLIEVDPKSRFSLLNLVGVEQMVEGATGIAANAFMRRSLGSEFRSSIAKDVVEVF